MTQWLESGTWTALRLALVLLLGFVSPVQAQISTDYDKDRVYNAGTPAEGQEEPTPLKDRGPTLYGMISQIAVTLFVFAGVAYAIIRYAKKGKLNWSVLRGNDKDPRLCILESRMLGNRQYLMVVEYEDQKMLLGVSPSRIEHLCFLNPPFESSENAAEVLNEEISRETRA